MKIKEVEGTLEEILEYQKANKVARQRVPMDESIKRAMYRLDTHWSSSKHQWIPIAEMDTAYIVNVIKKMCRENSNLILLQDDEFKSLIINLADKIEEKS